MLCTTLKARKHSVEAQSRDDWSGAALDCDIAILHGVRDPLVEAYRHVPTFIIESGYLKRINTRADAYSGHWQLSYSKLNGLPDFRCPPDRFDSLQFPLARSVRRKGYVLVLGQVPTDSALNGTDHGACLRTQIADYEAQGFEVRYRPHPRGGLTLNGIASLGGTLSDALDGCCAVVTYNSTSGFQVLLQGIPIMCDPCAPYYELSGMTCPPVSVRKLFFDRVGYGQWRCDQTPEAVDFLFSEWLPRCQR